MRRADLIGTGLLVLLAGFAVLRSAERAPISFINRDDGSIEQEEKALLGMARIVGQVDFELPLIDEEGTFSIAELRGRSIVGIVFVREECPYSTRLVERMRNYEKPAGQEVLFVSIGDRRSALLFKERNELAERILVDSGGVIANTYQLRSVPAYFAVDLEGHVEAVAIGEDRSWALMRKSRTMGCSSCGVGYNWQ